MKHTHRGTCQTCGAVQAIDARTGRLAKHGYQVAGFGYFNGVCQGTGHPPAEQDVALTRATVEKLGQYAAGQDQLAAELESGAKTLTQYWVKGDAWGRGAKLVQITAETPAAVVTQQTRLAVANHRSEAGHARRHAKMLGEAVLPRLGQPLQAAQHREAPVEIVAGTRVLAYGQPATVKGRNGARYWIEYDNRPGFRVPVGRRAIKPV